MAQDTEGLRKKLEGKEFTVKAFGIEEKIWLGCSRYRADNTLAVQAYHTAHKEGIEGFTEPYGTLTVCVLEATHRLEENELLVKTWSENSQWTASLLARYPEVFQDTGKRVSVGLVLAEIWKVL